MSAEATAQSIADRHAAAAAETLPAVKLIIDGEHRDLGSGGVYEQVNPATGRVQAELPLAGESEIDDAVQAARRGLKVWRHTHPAERRDILIRHAQLIGKEDWSTLSTLENGMPLSMSSLMTPIATGWSSYYASWADRIEGSVTVNNDIDGYVHTRPEPVGVVAAIITWNGPIGSIAMKVSPALAAGCSVVLKPTEFTTFTAMRWMELAREAGLPDGVVNLVPGGPDAGAALTAHPGIDKISFTGGPNTAKAIMRAAADTLTPCVFELGGKSANLIFDDADLDEAVAYSCGLATSLAGQGCALPTRMLVQRSVYDEVVARVEAIMGMLPLGDPLDPDTHVGPVISRAAQERIQGVIDRAKAEGSGRIVCGGDPIEGALAQGFYVDKTVFADVDPNSSLAREEIFGPVMCISPFDTEEDGIALANSTAYGLSGYVQSGDPRRISRVVDALECGTVGVNTGFCLHHSAPFGGVGISGFGREGGKAGLDEFVRYKTVLQK